jgi:hypothetical protein
MGRVHRRHDRPAARLEDAVGLGEEPAQLAQVLQDQPADDQVELGRERQRPVQVVDDEPDRLRARLAAGLGQHPRGEVHGRDGGARRGQPQGVTARAAAQVEHGQAPHVADGRPHRRPFQTLQRVAVVIVDGGPAVVTVADR